MSGVPGIPYRSLFAKSLNAISIHTVLLDGHGTPVDYTFDAVNPAFETMTGLNFETIAGRTVRQVTPRISKAWTDRYDRVALTGESDFFEDYSQELGRWYQVSTFQHKPLGFTVTFIDITQRVIEHDRAIEEAAKHRTFFELPNAMKLVIDVDSRAILDANAKAAEFYGWTIEELRGMKVEQINVLSPQEIDREINLTVTQKRDHFHFSHRLRTGEIRDVEVYASPGFSGGRKCLFSIVHDVTETKQIQQRLLQRERLSAVGQMTASLYHEFGNLLGTLFAQIQLMEMEIPPGETKDRLIGKVQKQFDRAQRLVESVKRFSRNQEVELRRCRLSPLLEDLVELEKPRCREAGIAIGFDPTSDDWVRVDTALVQQVFLNLFTNALHALQKTPKPQIFITVHLEAPEVVVRFGNNGPEIPADIKPKLFTAFFTTKRGVKQEGTGLGLSFSWTIVHNHGGTLFLEDGPGTVFQLRLPRQAEV